ncbi:MAG: MaoC/PaaZ C-terminal domain-containing protein [bacterium]|nr:MaoC/PaaZ C-terminal domain-containing protein [bacterium]
MRVSAGTELPVYEVEVRAAAMKTMAVLLRDPNPIHFDPHVVAALGMGDRVINQGPTNMAYVVDMLVAWAGDPARIQSLKVRFLDNVRGGDRVVAGGIVTSVAGDGQYQVAECDVWLDVVGGPRALAGSATVALEAGEAAGETPAK